MKRKEPSQQTTETISNDPTTPPQSDVVEVNHTTNAVKRYKSENFGPTFDTQSYTETLDHYKPVRSLTENSNLTKRREERETKFQESAILINRFQHTLDDSSGSPSFNTQTSNSSADSDPRVKKEKELAFIRGREPDFEFNGRYDPANAENLPKVRTEVKESIQLDVDDEIYRPRGNSDQTTESGDTKLCSSSSDQEGSVASQEDEFSVSVAVEPSSSRSNITTGKTTTTISKTTTATISTSSVKTCSLTATSSENADEESSTSSSSSSVAEEESRHSEESDDNTTN